MKLNRNYLTSSELMDIVKELVQHDNVVEREIIKIAMLVQILTDCEKKETANDYYDEYVKSRKQIRELSKWLDVIVNKERRRTITSLTTSYNLINGKNNKELTTEIVELLKRFGFDKNLSGNNIETLEKMDTLLVENLNFKKKYKVK